MKLTDLDPLFIRYEKQGEQVYHVTVESLDAAQGVRFLCPKCFVANGGPRGTHGVVCWSSTRGVPDDARPSPGRWALKGTGFDDLTLDCEPGKSRSVLLLSGCAWHGYVTNGDVTNA